MKIPELCKGCPNEKYFKDGKCWVYWKNKTECVTRFWLEEGFERR